MASTAGCDRGSGRLRLIAGALGALLLGCAADRVSYEASRYEQGLLTYSLLTGMRGAALREGDMVRAAALSIRAMPYVDAARAAGYSALHNAQQDKLLRDALGIGARRAAS